MSAEHAKALSMQAQLLQHSADVADLIARPASDRDADEILAAWSRLDRLRSPLNALLRKLRADKAKPGNALARKDYVRHRVRREDTKSLQRRLQMWKQMQSLVQRHITPQAQPLELVRPFNASDPMLDLLHKSLHRLANPNLQSESAQDLGCFPDIPLRPQLFDALILAAYRLLMVQGRAASARFLDIGCGGGTTVIAASRMFPVSHGLEYDPAYADAAKQFIKIVQLGNCDVFQGDGLTFDGYGDYDVIYFYRPMVEHDLLCALERRVFETARPGTVIIAPYDSNSLPRPGLDQSRIAGPIFVAGMTQKAANRLHENACLTEAGLVQRADDLRFDPGFWTPILQAASFNGASDI